MLLGIGVLLGIGILLWYVKKKISQAQRYIEIKADYLVKLVAKPFEIASTIGNSFLPHTTQKREEA